MITTLNNTINVSLGELAISDNHDDILACYGLGSCIGVTAFDPVKKMGALAHIVLPRNNSTILDSAPAKYADIAIPYMIQELEKKGVNKGRLIIKIAGGAKILSCIPAGSMLDIGEKNVIAVLEAISQQKLKVTNQDVRGNIGRTLFLHIKDGKTIIKTAMNQIVEL
jgi:chemotaxis protein CheD